MNSIPATASKVQPLPAQQSRNQRVLEYALAYVEAGFSIVPVKHNEKIPGVRWAQYQERPATVGEVKTWFGPGGSFEGANIALVTGRVSGVFAVDVDGPEGARVVDSNGVPETAVNVTRRGRHLVFAYPPGGMGNLKNFVGTYPEMDGRADGGIIIVAPSLHPEGDHEYHWGDSLDLSPAEVVASLEFATPPGWVVDMFAAEKRVSVPKPSASADEPIQLGERNSRMTAEIGRLVAGGLKDPKLLLSVAMTTMRGKLAPGVEPLDEGEVWRICQSVLSMEAEKVAEKLSIVELRARDENRDLPASMRAEALRYLTETSGLGVEWTAVVKYAKEKSEYEIRLAGGWRVPVGGMEHLSSFKAVAKVLMDTLGVRPAWSPEHWHSVLDQLLLARHTERIDEATPAGLLAGWLEGYMDESPVSHAPYGDKEWHQEARVKEPFIKDGEYYLNLPHFESHISTKVLNARYKPGEVATMMAKVGWERVTMNLPSDGGRPRTTVRVWRVPGGAEMWARRIGIEVTKEDGSHDHN